MQNQMYSRRSLGRLLSGLSVMGLVGCAAGLKPSRTAEVRGNIASYALTLLDKPYVWGGQNLETGFDCSGLVSHVYRQAAGIEVKGNAAAMAKAARAVSTADIQTGDLLFFNTQNRPASHVGIYVGNSKFVHASNPRTGVRVDRLENTYYAKRFEGAKTLLG